MLLSWYLALFLGAVELVHSAPVDMQDAVMGGNSEMERFQRMKQYLDFFYESARIAGLESSTLCEDDWVAFKGSCYMFEDVVKLNWTEAKTVCFSHHAHLVTIETVEEDAFLRGFAMRLFKNAQDRSKQGFYIGATDMEEEGVWRWYTTNLKLQYNSLRSNQVRNAHEDCALLWGDFEYDWGDIDCNRKCHFICERTK